MNFYGHNRRLISPHPNHTTCRVSEKEKAIRLAKCASWWAESQAPITDRTRVIDRQRQAEGTAAMWGLDGLFQQ